MTELRVTVPDEIADRLEERARQGGTTSEKLASDAVRSLVGDLHKPQSDHRLGFIGIGRSGGHESVAERHEEIIREHFVNKSAADA